MNFVNEFVSAKDIARYRLDDLYKDFSPWSWRDGRPSTFKHYWTINKARNTFLVLLGYQEETGQTGRLEPTANHVFHLQVGERVSARVVLERSTDSSTSLSERPFRRIWNVLAIETTGIESRTSDQYASTLQTLKEALDVFGLAGAYQQVPQTVVELRNIGHHD